MGKYEYIKNGGLAFDEDKIIEELREKSKEGWILDKVGTWSFRLKRGEAKEMIHALVYDMNYDDDSFIELFEEAGWSVAGRGGGISFFKAIPGTTPLYTDKESHAEKYKKFRGLTVKPMICSGVIAIILFMALFFDVWKLDIFKDISREWILWGVTILLIIDIFVLVPCVMVNLGFKSRLKSIEEGRALDPKGFIQLSKGARKPIIVVVSFFIGTLIRNPLGIEPGRGLYNPFVNGFKTEMLIPVGTWIFISLCMYYLLDKFVFIEKTQKNI